MGEGTHEKGKRGDDMNEQDLEARDSSNGAPLLECLVVGLGAVELILMTLVAIWLWEV